MIERQTGLEPGFYAGGLALSAAMVVLACALALATGVLAYGRSLRAEDLRRE